TRASNLWNSLPFKNHAAPSSAVRTQDRKPCPRRPLSYDRAPPPCSTYAVPASQRSVYFLFQLLRRPARPRQDLDKPLQNIDEEVTSFGFTPNGGIAYSVRRHIKTKKYDLQHDDI